MKKILFLFMTLLFAGGVYSQIATFNGTDTIGNGRTITTTAIKLAETPIAIWPVHQVYYDYTSGTADIAITGWYSLDNVRWDTIPNFNVDYSTDADYTNIFTTVTWESPLIAKYIKFTARGHTGVQSGKPKGYFFYLKATNY